LALAGFGLHAWLVGGNGFKVVGLHAGLLPGCWYLIASALSVGHVKQRLSVNIQVAVIAWGKAPELLMNPDRAWPK
jgi:hypothetical protein